VVDAPSPERKRVVIVGGGFAGLAAAHALRHADAEVVLIDRRNHDIFQLTLRKARLSAAGRRNLVVDFYETGERSTDARY
jgi:NADH dehydrogenase